MTVVAAVLTSSVVVALAYLGALALVAVILALRVGGRREETADDFDALSASRFTIPVSLIVPVSAVASGFSRTSENRDLSATLAGLLNLSYPEFEVIVVVEGLPAAEWTALKREWALEAKEFFYRQSLATASVTKIYRSASDHRLMVVDKAPTRNLADALNCGVNLARFRYVSAVEPGLLFDADALLRAMSAPLRDPAGVVAATSHIESRADDVHRARLGEALQRLASIRSLLDSRLVWRTLHAALGTHDAVAVWRRDAIVQLGGFSTRAVDPDLDMMVRLQTATPTHTAGRVARSAEIFGQAGPRSFASLARLATRRQLAALQTVSSCRKLAGPTFAYFVISELVTPLVQAWVVLAVTAGALAGWMAWRDVALTVVLLSFGRAIVSGAAVLVRGSAPGAPDESTLVQLLLVAPFEFVVSGSVKACARGLGFWAFLKDGIAEEPIA